jgi:hypothetical protein
MGQVYMEGKMKIAVLLGLIVGVTINPALAQTPANPDTARTAMTPAAATSLAVGKTAFCTGVENREPSGEATEFPANVGKLYFWSVVTGATEPTTVAHVWYLDDKQVARVELPIKYPRSRVWSTKIVADGITGTWKVEVVTADDRKLIENTCTVK